MYKLIFGRPVNYMVLYRGDLEECVKRRQVSGDIVVDALTNEIVQGDDWLRPWERNNPDCYARKMQRMGWIY